MIWALRATLVLGALGLGALALRPGDPVPAAEPPDNTPTVVATAVPIAAAATPRPKPPTEFITSRVVRETPAPRATSGGAVPPQVAAVEFSYQPTRLRVRQGTTVTFRNSGSEGHDFLGGGPDGTWWSGPLAPTETYQRQFTQSGSYDYLCSFHSEMQGTIIVGP